jgi:hypothetical protein
MCPTVEGRRPMLFNVFIIISWVQVGPFEARCMRKHVKENMDFVFTDTMANPKATECKKPLASM